MNWYIAHIIMFVKTKNPPQDRFPVWENVVLVAAGTEAEAFEKSERFGRSEEGDDGGSFRWGQRPAEWVFAGVRKLHEFDGTSILCVDGIELTSNELELDFLEDVRKFAAGEDVQVIYRDRFRPPATVSPEKAAGSQQNEGRRA